MSVTLVKSTNAPVSLVKVTDALAPLNAPRAVLRDLYANDLDALSEMFTLGHVRALLKLESDLLEFDQKCTIHGVDYARNGVWMSESIDAQLDALTAGKYRATS